MAKKKSNLVGLGVLAALGLGAAVAFGKQKPSGDLVTGKSGKQWRVAMLSNVGGLKTYDITTPAGSFGPHADLSVLRYSQQDADIGSRQVVGIGQGVPNAIIVAAGSDFSIPIDPSRLPAA